jgi:transcriptional regulator with XRE-family HTH domain
MDARKTFGANIRKLRTQKGWSQDKLAEASGLHRTYISGIERCARNPTLQTIVALAAAFGVDPSVLLEGGDKHGSKRS